LIFLTPPRVIFYLFLSHIILWHLDVTDNLLADYKLSLADLYGVSNDVELGIF